MNIIGKSTRVRVAPGRHRRVRVLLQPRRRRYFFGLTVAFGSFGLGQIECRYVSPCISSARTKTALSIDGGEQQDSRNHEQGQEEHLEVRFHITPL